MKRKILLVLYILGTSVGVMAQVTHLWDFNSAVVNNKVDGWNIYVYDNANTNNGILNLTAIKEPNLGYCDINYSFPQSTPLDPEVNKQLVFRVKNGTLNSKGRFMWTTDTDTKVFVDFLLTKEDADFREYTIDLSHDVRWRGAVRQIYLQLPYPVNEESRGKIINIDYVKFIGATPAPSPMPSAIPAPFGVNLAGAEFAKGTQNYGYPYPEELDYYKSKGLSLIRLPFRWDRIQPELNGALDERELSMMKRFVAEARKRNIWVLLDMHNSCRRFVNGSTTEYIIGSPELPVSSVSDGWKKIAEQFKNFENIWGYGIMNEPHGLLPETPWFNIAQAIITDIRSVDSQTTIVVGGESYSSAQRWVSESDNLRFLQDPSDNIIYEAHAYFDNDASGTYTKNYDQENATPTKGIDRIKPFVDWLKKYKLRGFIGEYGVPDDDPRWLTVLDNALKYMKENHLNGTYWAGGMRWGTYSLDVQPRNGVDRPQTGVLEQYPYADVPSMLPEIKSPLTAFYNVNNQVSYTVKAINNPLSFTVAGLPQGLTYDDATRKITGTITPGVYNIELTASNTYGTSTSTLVLTGIKPTFPGTLELEHYDDGGQNVGYYDTTLGNGSSYTGREDDVDLRVTNTATPSLTNTVAGEWLKYTITVEQTKSYRMRVNYSGTPAIDAKFYLKLNGQRLTPDTDLPFFTGSTTNWRNVQFDVPEITAGIHTLELHVVNGGFDVDDVLVTVNTPPGMPGDVQAEAFGSKKINLTWNNVSVTRGYTVKRAISLNGTYTAIATGITGTSFTDEDVNEATTYYYVISASNLAGEGPNSAKINATTTAFTVPQVISGLKADAGDARVQLVWNAVPDVTNYRVERSTTSGGAYAVVSNTTNLRFVDLTASNDVTYFYRIIAENEKGAGDASQEIDARPEEGRYSYWNFDEISGKQIQDAWSDKMGNLNLQAGFDANGKEHGALRLNGQTYSYVNLPDNIMNNIQDFTISTWAKLGAILNGSRIFDFSSSNNAYMFLTPTNTQNKKVSFVIRNGGTEQQIQSNVELVTQQWVHIAVTKSGNTGVLYINGQEVGRNSSLSINPSDLGNTIYNYLGRSGFTNTPVLNGWIDEFKIYNKALSATDIAALKEGTLPVTFVSFTGKKQNDKTVLLNWETATEKDNSHFEVYRSADGRTFSKLGDIPAFNSSSAKRYQFVDEMPMSGANYYQLRQIDFNGKSAFYPRIVAIEGFERKNLKLFIVENTLNLNAFALVDEPFELILSDLSGRVLARFKDHLYAGNNLKKFPFQNFVSGIYVATYLNNKEKISVKLYVAQ